MRKTNCAICGTVINLRHGHSIVSYENKKYKICPFHGYQEVLIMIYQLGLVCPLTTDKDITFKIRDVMPEKTFTVNTDNLKIHLS